MTVMLSPEGLAPARVEWHSISGGKPAFRTARFPDCALLLLLYCPPDPLQVHSYLSDSMGSSLAAFHAGQSPKIKPIPTLATSPPTGAQSGT